MQPRPSPRPWSELPFAERLVRLGDEAELKYETDRRARGVRFTDYGLRRPPFNGREMAQLPTSIRHGPDYIESWGGRLRFVEVQGVGADQRCKLKDAKLQALAEANAELAAVLWVWNSPLRLYAVVPFTQVALLMADGATHGQLGVFDAQGRNPKPFTWVEWAKLIANASTHRVLTQRAVAMGTSSP
jgi:hypothetical protein